MTPPSSARRPRGFTLIEVLVVISIIVLLMSLAVPALVSVMQGNRLSTAGQNMVSRLSQAQQLASAQNLPVEVRFYQFQDNTQITNGAAYGAYQFVLVHTKVDSATHATSEYGEPLSSPYFLENGVFITTGTISVNGSGGLASPLLDSSGGSQFTDGNSSPGGVTQQIQRGGSAAKFVAIRILPNGEVKKVLPGGTDVTVGNAYKLQTLALNQAYFTIVSQKDMTTNGTVYNYYAIQLDPYTGHIRTYQPGIQTH